MDNLITADALTTFDVSPDGSRVRLNVRDHQGDEGSLELPATCVNQLLMTLPRIIELSMRRLSRDGSLRLVHPLEGFSVELGEPDRNGTPRYILTLKSGGFGVSFAADSVQIGTFIETAVDQVLAPGEPVLEPMPLN